MDTVASEQLTQEKINELIERAKLNKKKAYCVYSKFEVGCVLLDEKGNLYDGCNVENASYGLTICAERSAIVHAKFCGMQQIRAICINLDVEEPMPPCGACRQVIDEFSTASTIVISSNQKGDHRIWTQEQCLPSSFKKTDLIKPSQ